MNEEDRFLLEHRAHDAVEVLARWETLGRELGWERRVFREVAGYEVAGYRSVEPPRIYLSAGVHGDEAAAVWGLLDWAERHREKLGTLALGVMPCFSPWGLAENRRVTALGEDLNRLFHRRDHDLIGAWQSWLEGWELEIGICLHEDYDARGIYLYELSEEGLLIGEACLQRCEVCLPREPGPDIDGRPMSGGWIAFEGDPEDLVREMAEEMPEAIYLRQLHARRVMTFETPSEYSFYRRVRCQTGFLDAVMEELARKGVEFAENFCGM